MKTLLKKIKADYEANGMTNCETYKEILEELEQPEYSKILYTLLSNFEDRNGTEELIMLLYCNITESPDEIAKILDIDLELIKETIKNNV